jgi:hypothetical protein
MVRFHNLSKEKAPEYGFALVYPEVLDHIFDYNPGHGGIFGLCSSQNSNGNMIADIARAAKLYIFVASRISGSQPYPIVSHDEVYDKLKFTPDEYVRAFEYLSNIDLLNAAEANEFETQFEVFTVLPENGVKKLSFHRRDLSVPSKVENRRS